MCPQPRTGAGRRVLRQGPRSGVLSHIRPARLDTSSGYGADVASAGARVFEYAVAQDRAGRLTAEGHAQLELAAAWTPEHLVLAGLLRCTLQSLRHHADRAEIDFTASASAAAKVTRREVDDRYAFTEVGCRLDLAVEPEPTRDELLALLVKAERDCFVGASLTVDPTYRWRVNGTDVDRVAP